jgi:hypothetical protein
MKQNAIGVAIVLFVSLAPWPLTGTNHAEADSKAEKTFNAVITDTQGIQTEMKNVSFYWEEKSARPRLSPMSCGSFP